MTARRWCLRAAWLPTQSEFSHASGVFHCDVGVPLWTPPELQGRDFRGLTRTKNHDRFGLAVLMFQLLFMGRHPFAGVPDRPEQFESRKQSGSSFSRSLRKLALLEFVRRLTLFL